MQYGIRTSNGSAITQMDSESKVLTVAASGSYASVNSYEFTITYATPITTQQKPFIFLKPSGLGFTKLILHLGGPGNWTGFYARDTGSGKWMAGVFNSIVQPSQYDIRITDSSGSRLFSGSDNIIQLKGAPNSTNWVFNSEGFQSGGVYWSGIQAPWTGSFDDYFLASTAAAGRVYNGNSTQETQIGFSAGNRQVIKGFIGTLIGSETGAVFSGRTTFAARPMRPI